MSEVTKFLATLLALSIFVFIVALLLGVDWSFLKYPLVFGIGSFVTLFIIDQF